MSDLKFCLFIYNPEANISELLEENSPEVSPFSMNLIENDEGPELIVKSKKSKLDINSRIIRLCSRIRYLLISHKPPKL